jgi:hypothetical protein
MSSENYMEIEPILQVIIPDPDFSCMDVEWVYQEFQCQGTTEDMLILVPYGCSPERKELLSVHFDKVQGTVFEPSLAFVMSIFSLDEKLLRMVILYLMHHFPQGSEQKIIIHNYGTDNIEELWKDLAMKIEFEMRNLH